MPLLLEQLGLVHLGGEHAQRLVGAEGRGALLGTLQAMRPMLAASAFVTSGALDRLQVLSAHPALVTMGGSTLSLWGQRP